jgi:hypothetical protein
MVCQQKYTVKSSLAHGGLQVVTKRGLVDVRAYDGGRMFL